MGGVGDRGEESGLFDFFVVLGLLREHDEENARALGMADVVELLLAGRVEDVVYRRGHVVDAHLVPRKLPELRVTGRKVHVCLGVGVSPGVTQPDVVTGVG